MFSCAYSTPFIALILATFYLVSYMLLSKANQLSIKGAAHGLLARFLVTKLSHFRSASLIGLCMALPVVMFCSKGMIGELTFTQGGLIILVVSVCQVVAFRVLKSLVFADPARYLTSLGLPILLLTIPLYPLALLGEVTIIVVGKLLGTKENEDAELIVAPEHLSEIVEHSSQAGEIKEEQSQIIQGAIALSDKLVREIMTPRKDIIYVTAAVTLPELVATFTKFKLSRLLVIGNGLDDIRGIVVAKDLLTYIKDDQIPFALATVLRKPYFVPSSKKAGELLKELRAKGVHLAVVVDEHGGVDGIATIEDLIEELVGEIYDEHDIPGEEERVRQLASGELLIQGGTTLGELAEKFHIQTSTGDYDTIAGFVINQLGRIPRRGEWVETDSFRLRVEEVHDNRITTVRYVPHEKAEPTSSKDASKSEERGVLLSFEKAYEKKAGVAE